MFLFSSFGFQSSSGGAGGGSYIREHSFDPNNNYDYNGYARSKTSVDSPKWTITRLIIANDGTVTSSGQAIGSWTNRANLIYS